MPKIIQQSNLIEKAKGNEKKIGERHQYRLNEVVSMPKV